MVDWDGIRPYAWTKATNTESVMNYGQWYGLEFAITYFYNVYGPREITCGEYATLLGIFPRQFEAGEPLTVVSPGTQRRNFTHVDDIVRGLILVGEFGSGDEYGLGADASYSVLDIASLFGDETRMLPEGQAPGMVDPILRRGLHRRRQRHALTDRPPVGGVTP
tara:strand:+ start:254 stop:745 length:492 start_codon:yes stop_codon:yes gene_type:complete